MMAHDTQDGASDAGAAHASIRRCRSTRQEGRTAGSSAHGRGWGGTRRWLVALLLGVSGCGGQNAGAPPPVAVQTSRARDELYALGGALDQLLADPGRVPSPELGVALRQTRMDVAWLERSAASWPPSPAVDAFSEAILAHRQLLAETGRTPAAEAAPVLDALARDLAVKTRQCRTFGGPVPVDVRVVTRDAQNREVHGYEVWYVRKAYERDPAAFRRFEQNSSPASHTFNEAGYYVLWADHLSARAQRQPPVPLNLEVGADRRQQLVDLFVPGGTPNPLGAPGSTPNPPVAPNPFGTP